MDLYYQVLEFLKENQGIYNPISLEPLLKQVYPNPLTYQEYMDGGMEQVRTVLLQLSEAGFIKMGSNYTPNGSSFSWNAALTIMVELTRNGNLELEKKSANELSIKVSKSVIKTGKSVVSTNTAMVDLTTKQTVVNNKIADNSKAQTDILKSQKWILWMAVFVAACSAFISYLSYRKDVPDNQLKQEIKVINKRIDTLMQLLPQTKRFPQKKMVNDVLPKRK